jgi:Fur family iron response transcriptional regulator
MLHAEAATANEKLSLATVYNALRDFERAGLIRRVAVPSERVWFDTDTGAHRHFFIESEGRVLDVPVGVPITPPDGYRVTRVDTVVHLEKVAEHE